MGAAVSGAARPEGGRGGGARAGREGRAERGEPQCAAEGVPRTRPCHPGATIALNSAGTVSFYKNMPVRVQFINEDGKRGTTITNNEIGHLQQHTVVSYVSVGSLLQGVVPVRTFLVML